MTFRASLIFNLTFLFYFTGDVEEGNFEDDEEEEKEGNFEDDEEE
jgi:hypothetical protein